MQMNAWQLDLEARVASLADAEARLDAAERAVTEANERVTNAEHALDAARGDVARTRRVAAPRRAALHGALRAPRRRSANASRPNGAVRSTSCCRRLQPLELDDDALRAEADALRQQLEALGPVNPLAIEEHDEEVKRLDFLTTQRTDLADAKKSLAAGDPRDRHHGARAVPVDVHAGARELPPDLHDAVRRRRVRPAPREPGRCRSTATSRSTRRRAASGRSAFTCCRAASARSSRCRCSSASSSRSRARSACSTKWTRRSTTRTSVASCGC